MGETSVTSALDVNSMDQKLITKVEQPEPVTNGQENGVESIIEGEHSDKCGRPIYHERKRRVGRPRKRTTFGFQKKKEKSSTNEIGERKKSIAPPEPWTKNRLRKPLECVFIDPSVVKVETDECTESSGSMECGSLKMVNELQLIDENEMFDLSKCGRIKSGKRFSHETVEEREQRLDEERKIRAENARKARARRIARETEEGEHSDKCGRPIYHERKRVGRPTKRTTFNFQKKKEKSSTNEIGERKKSVNAESIAPPEPWTKNRLRKPLECVFIDPSVVKVETDECTESSGSMECGSLKMVNELQLIDENEMFDQSKGGRIKSGKRFTHETVEEREQRLYEGQKKRAENARKARARRIAKETEAQKFARMERARLTAARWHAQRIAKETEEQKFARMERGRLTAARWRARIKQRMARTRQIAEETVEEKLVWMEGDQSKCVRIESGKRFSHETVEEREQRLDEERKIRARKARAIRLAQETEEQRFARMERARLTTARWHAQRKQRMARTRQIAEETVEEKLVRMEGSDLYHSAERNEYVSESFEYPEQNVRLISTDNDVDNFSFIKVEPYEQHEQWTGSEQNGSESTLDRFSGEVKREFAVKEENIYECGEQCSSVTKYENHLRVVDFREIK